VETINDLKPGMVLEGTVSNVAAFGAFVDIGVHQDGLVHVSAMSSRFVADPREVVQSGQVVKVKVLEVDVPRKRISLTLRLDDEPGAGRNAGAGTRGGEDRRRQPGEQRSGGQQQGGPRQGGSQQRTGSEPGRGQRSGAQQGGAPRGKRPEPADTALAEALRRAGLA
jgi:uncharacterized protein